MLIGLTGGIASGKSTVASMLRAHGAVIIDADRLSREVVEPGTPALTSIRARFGESVITADGALDRQTLGTVVFGDADARRDLNAIVHPAVRDRAAKRIREIADADPRAVIVYDVPLLAESGMTDAFDLVVVADAPTTVRHERLVSLRGMTPEDATRRIASQASDDERRRIADVVIDTSGSLEKTRAEVDRLWQRISSENGR
ncbi:dephospho-CoA kinase [Microbacterium sp. MPKO10]|uniref:dephospho-CoA kinase n=1 Tax=Microbacterium sp. MPKO10 TaxID=2989818 RepID=UPI002235C6C6|nr:dephospho-CoA kinase [Microbacterium sp. MPKO10]MCW4459508.1 dephospho-CoA kinase [Microbacterium sp. MPKO10]